MRRCRGAPVHEVVDSLVIPARVAGDPALELCNTRAGWGEPTPKEYLVSYDHLLVWAREVGAIDADLVETLRRDAQKAPGPAARVLAQVTAFREHLYDYVTGSEDPQVWNAIASQVEQATKALTLVRSTEGARWAINPAVGLRYPLLAIAAAAGDLITSGDVRDVSACPGRGCGWLFTNPTGRRRWCSMAICGNRAKARRHAERHRRS
jgi:predicted RNA-binding Zn ribbon-like protein